jgi:hypothetical protein
MGLDWASIAVSKRMRVALALILTTFLSSSAYYVYSRVHGTLGFNTGNSPHAISHPETSRDHDLNLALVTAPPENPRITAAVFAQTRFYAALPQAHLAAHKEEIALQDLAADEWILFARRAHPGRL